MSEADRETWDRRYASGSHGNREHPTALLAEWEPRLPRGRALDVACGTGRNALFLAATGRGVDAIDISGVALARARGAAARRGLDVDLVEADLEAGAVDALRNRRYGLIVLVRYVNRGLLPRLAAALSDGGYLLVEQHLVTSAEGVVGPRTPAFRYAPNELLRSVVDLADPAPRVLFYRESVVEDPDGRSAALAQLVACRGPGPL